VAHIAAQGVIDITIQNVLENTHNNSKDEPAVKQSVCKE